jgi:para-nitrobenzyl esterase
MIRCVLFLLALAFASAAGASADAPVAQTSTGRVLGATAGGIEVFRGVPYAAPPVGNLRWRPPQPPAKWGGVRDATAFGASCPQSLDSPMMMVGPLVKIGEDCLTLNVWTPATDTGRRPVMLWIHGGGFFTGAGSEKQFDGIPYAERGVVLVTVNYRLGRLGFFAHPALKAVAGEPRGNYGLMDVLAALRWVRDNIASFGGDPGNVTIFGESAGGIAVADLMVSPMAQGLFQKAIIESGAFPRPMRDIATDRPGAPSEQTLGRAFAEGLGIGGNDPAAALRALPVEKIAPGAPDELGQIQAMASPMVDGAMLPDDVFLRYAKGEITKVPLLIGSTGAEALVWAFGRDGKMATYPLLPFDPVRFRSAFGSDADRVMAAYGARYGGDMANAGPILATDMAVGAASRYFADRAAAAGCPTFLYHFSAIPTPLRGLTPGAPHGTEIPYVFGTLAKLRNVGGGMTESDLALSRTVIAYWVSFAKTGNPNGAGRLSWPPRSGKDGAFLDFTDQGPVAAADDPITAIFEQRIAAGLAAPAPTGKTQ